ncbi:MAG TPA: methyltransferase domain-containing protein [Thermoanaerobaculia bacterium]
MSVREWYLFLRQQRSLRALQNAYYDAGQPNEAVIAEYFRALEAARTQQMAIASSGEQFPRRVHLGSGDHWIAGWINIDFDATKPLDVVADLRRDFPLRTASVDLLHSEDFLEHLDESDGRAVLRECHRVLRAGGVMRLLTPDLRALIDEVYIRRDPRHLRWCGTYLDARGPCSALNMHMRMNGEHRFIYDEEQLTTLLRDTGFDVRRARYNWSIVPELRFLDLRDFGLNLFLECLKR